MGTVAEATRLAGGRVVGIIPQALVDKELANQLCDELHVVTSMHERKAMMAERSDAFLAAVVEGYLSGDGHHDVKNDRWRLGFCANDEWAADLRTLAARLGAKISLRRTQHVGNYGTFRFGAPDADPEFDVSPLEAVALALHFLDEVPAAVDPSSVFDMGEE